jgi:hypothetical protein
MTLKIFTMFGRFRYDRIQSRNKKWNTSVYRIAWATIIHFPSKVNFPAPDSAVFLARKTCFRLHI